MADANGPRAEILRSRDFIGWAVTSANGANVGTVADILIDRGGKVRFLAVDSGFFKKPFLLPVELLEWGEGSLQTSLTDVDVKRLPPYDPGVTLTAPVLAELGRAFPRYYGEHRGTAYEPGEGASVVPLKDARDFRLSKGAPNLKGWTVYAADNEKVGTVTQMLVDPVAMKVRYVDVDLADDLFGLVDDRHVLVPLEAVELRERGEDVWVQGLSGREIAQLPAYLGGPVDPLLEEASERAFRLSEQRPPVLVQGDEDATAPLAPPVARDAEFASPPPVVSDAEFAAPPPAAERPPIVVDEGPRADDLPPPLPDEAPPPPPDVPTGEGAPPIIVDDTPRDDRE